MYLAESNIKNTFSISPFDEYYLPSVNRKMFDTIDSKTQYNKKFKSHFSKEDMLQIIVGMDSGLLVNYLLEQGIPDGSIFIFIELNSVLSLLNIDIPKELIDKLYIYSLEDFQSNFPSTSYGIYLLKNNFKHYRSLAATSSHLPEYSILNTQVVKMLEAEHLEQMLSSSQKKYFEQQFKNVSENMLPASLLADKFKDKSCLVVAGGPSLDENLNWIKSNHQKLFIIAVSRVAGKLASEGITPHIIVSVDPYDFSFEVNRDMMALAESSLFVNSFHVSSRLLGQWEGKSLFMDCQYPWQLESKGNIETLGPTVTNASVHLATKMGFSRIILTGVDLCFTDDGFTHTKGSVEAKIGPNLGIMGEWIETYEGRKAETVTQLKLAMESLANEASQNPKIEYLNLSLKAAKVKGISYKNTNEIQLQHNNITPTEFLESIPNLTIQERKQSNLTSKKEFSRLSDTLIDIIDLSEKALKLNTKLKDENITVKQRSENTAEIDLLDERINQGYSSVAKLIKTYGLAEFSDFLTTKKTDEWNKNHVHQMTDHYYQAFIVVAEQLLELAHDTQIRLDHRIDELSSMPDFSTLTEFWRKDLQHGRVNIWLSAHKNWQQGDEYKDNADLVEKNTQLIKSIANEYIEQLAITPKEYIETVKESASMENVFEKIIVLIRDNDHTALVKMSKNLQKLSDNSDEAKRLYHLTYCHQLQLEKNETEALQVLLNLDRKLQTEIELKQISLLALKTGQIDVAEYALTQLTKCSEDYIPQHAHVLKLLGRFEESINAYLDYLNKYPEDVTTWLKLGLFMIEVKELESAKTAFYHALQADPNNQTAQSYLKKLS
ncbi:motility associated factor glycosyltransferase family protein [Shewanella nanhaiensis]|uniref:DUF115 domain-containing protein n=1 Tax=Shewanella nanhaiensis TaxID=2864872 RepID=A0ABS7EA54_9GAMM|nr:6-hydroxymethylpterin diphosphokinase MptE-like protein [Shewanella nanhaiensis]MBW8186485.1 DUF115 domain-containing protein [Shewanella nanhaiensis]